jgi:hypothetical protein
MKIKNKFWLIMIHLSSFIDWVNDTYIDTDDFEILTPIGKVFAYIPLILNIVFLILISPLLYIQYLIINTKWWENKKIEIEKLNEEFRNKIQ